MKQFVFLIICGCLAVLTAFSSCKENEDDYLPPELMKALIKEIHLADATAEKFETILPRRMALREDLYMEVLDEFGISKEEFMHSYKYYLLNAGMMDTIYGQLIQEIAVQAELVKEGGKDPREKTALPDSLEKIGK